MCFERNTLGLLVARSCFSCAQLKTPSLGIHATPQTMPSLATKDNAPKANIADTKKPMATNSDASFESLRTTSANALSAPKHERPTHKKQTSIVLNSTPSKPLHVEDRQTVKLKKTSEKRLETTHKRTNVVRFLRSSPRISTTASANKSSYPSGYWMPLLTAET